jgi:hypothetical protein
MDATAPVLVYVYGPPASGKLTVAEHLRDLTGIRLFHNHLTVNAVREVFDVGTPQFTELLHRIRRDVFSTAMRAGTSLIFTNNSAWAGPGGRERFEAFAASAAVAVASGGGRTVFVHLTAPLSVLEARVANESRQAHGKLIEIGRLRELVAELDDSVLHADDLDFDTGTVAALDVATAIHLTLNQ